MGDFEAAARAVYEFQPMSDTDENIISWDDLAKIDPMEVFMCRAIAKAVIGAWEKTNEP